MLADEIGDSLQIGSIAFAMYDSGGPGSTTYHDFEVYMGLTDRDTLGAVFQANYIPGTRTVVLSESQMQISVSPDEEILLGLDTPFPYPGTGNLIVEVAYSSSDAGGSEILSWHWLANGTRVVAGNYLAAGGTMFFDMAPWLVLDQASGLSTVTWARLKRSVP